MLIPNTFGLLSSLTGMSGDAEPIFGAPRRVPCAIATLNAKIMKTSVRTDSSASRGDAEETEFQSEILFPARIKVNIEDRFVIAGFTMRVSGVSPRFDTCGRLDHNEVTLLTLVEQP